MVISEGLSIFTGFNEGGSGGILPCEKLNVQEFYFNHSSRPLRFRGPLVYRFSHCQMLPSSIKSTLLSLLYRCCHHNTHIQIEINKA